jgi:hypothetical protein
MPVALAEDKEIAVQCVELLALHGIVAKTSARTTLAAPYGVTVLVPKKLYNHAFAIINEKIDPTGFFDTSPIDSNAPESTHLIQSSANPTQAA